MKRKKVTDIRNGIVDTVKENKKQSRNVVLVRNVITVKAGTLNMQSRSSQGVVTCVMSSVYVIIVSSWLHRKAVGREQGIIKYAKSVK